MNTHEMQELLRKFRLGIVTPEEAKQLEGLIETGTIRLDEIEDIRSMEDRIGKIQIPSPSHALDDRFYKILKDEMLKDHKELSWSLQYFMDFFTGPGRMVRFAAASVLIVTGVAIGYFFATSARTDQQVELLTDQIADLKELMVLTLLDKEEATERLKAVSLTNEMDEASARVTRALIQTLNNDDNINVRLAALDALKPYTNDSRIREELVRSIRRQDSPLVQVALAELMAALQEKSSVKEWRRILENQDTPEDIKEKIRETIQVMI